MADAATALILIHLLHDQSCCGSKDGNCHVCIDTVPRCIYLPTRA